MTSFLLRAVTVAGLAVTGLVGADAANAATLRYTVELNELERTDNTGVKFGDVPITASFTIDSDIAFGSTGTGADIGFSISAPGGSFASVTDVTYSTGNLFSFGPNITIAQPYGTPGRILPTLRIGLSGTAAEGKLFALISSGGFFNNDSSVDPASWSVRIEEVQPSAVPLPATALLLVGGLGGLSLLRRRKAA